MARKGTDPTTIKKIYEGYKAILEKDEIKDLFNNMMLAIDPLDATAIDQYLSQVRAMVKANL